MTQMLIALKDLIVLENVEQLSSQPRQNFDSIKQSISEDGLLNPLSVVKQNAEYIVIDGKKRLKAIRAIVKAQKQTQAFNKILCQVQETREDVNPARRRPALLSGPKLAHAIITQINLGVSAPSVAQRFACEDDVINDAISLKRLHPELLSHFSASRISLEQAGALATIPNPKAQLTLFNQLGSFFSNSDIIASIKNGAMILELPNDDILILPTRDPRHTPKPGIRKVQTDNIYSLAVAAA